jgi:hypothetical protein
MNAIYLILPTMSEKTKLQINLLNKRFRQERLLIASGAVFNLISSNLLPASSVAIAIDLGISVPMVRRAIAALEEDQLVVQTYEGNWAIALKIAPTNDNP